MKKKQTKEVKDEKETVVAKKLGKSKKDAGQWEEGNLRNTARQGR